MLNRYDQFTTAISSAYKNIQKIKRDVMIRYGLKGPHAQCLLAMNRHEGGVIISQLCEICELDKAAVSRVVSELEEKGMVERGAAGDKLYRAPLRLTASGCEVARHISVVAEQAVELAGMGLSDEDRQVFYRALELIAGNLQRIARNGLPDISIEEEQESHE